jgi:hypothetical protein
LAPKAPSSQEAIELYIWGHPEIPDVSICAFAGMIKPVIMMARASPFKFFIFLLFYIS